MMTLDLILHTTGQYDPAYCIYVSLPSLALPSIQNLDRCVNLLELNLSSNSLSSLTGLESCKKLERLDVSCNLLKSLSAAWFESLGSLTTLHVEGNEVSEVDDVYALSDLSSLTTLTFQLPEQRGGSSSRRPNPLCSHPSYLSKAALACPSLTVLDGSVLSLPSSLPDVGPDEEYVVDLPVASWLEADRVREKAAKAAGYVGEGGEEEDLRDAFASADLELERAQSK
eukprot:CAMPEP_0182461748 /NCGR_PEP_ID=MMETSP1319-20130603/6237_1 /TAXON_ID=172717 /ORGANISM="Bolidomonas pacifica, Strain RCC208" /LENGTH=226 /DNA_ID=CAMNT_0024661077 /DNA_START=78 /DNA_END=755 /DNA_ORIENTATION=+